MWIEAAFTYITTREGRTIVHVYLAVYVFIVISTIIIVNERFELVIEEKNIRDKAAKIFNVLSWAMYALYNAVRWWMQCER
jgi:hypothetical protein